MSLPPLLFALAMWFLGTAAVVWLDSRPRATFARSFRVAGVVAAGATFAAWATRDDPSGTAAYIGFASAILIWGWHEMGFLMGIVAGPRRTPCPASATGWARFRLATATVIHHELAIAAHLALLVAIGWGAANQAATLTFALLFAARLSAKLNLFLGVANLSDEIFPAHLAYLKSYFGRRTVNPLFPLSIVAGVAATTIAWRTAETSAPDSGIAVTAALFAALAALGVVEHLFLVLPLRDGAMWRWAHNKQAGIAPAAID